MNKVSRWSAAVVVTLMLALSTSPVTAQGRPKDGDRKQAEHGKEHGKPDKVRGADQQGPDKALGNAKKKSHGKPEHVEAKRENKRVRFTAGDRGPARVANAAVARAHARGGDNSLFVIDPSGDRVRIKNRTGAVLIDLDEDRARRLGAWNVRPAHDRGNADGPAFCRSGAGHPNWGRQWCIDKGFGLGTANHIRWGSASTVSDIIFGQTVTTGSLARAALLSAIGDLAFNRLALHAVTLGYADPLTGVWVADQTGLRVLQINAGNYPVAEIVDTNRDNRADILVVALRAP